MGEWIRALYIDDTPALLEMTWLFLEQLNDFIVGIPTSEQESLANPEHHTYDALLSDYPMPEMDAIEFLKAVRGYYGDKPFILFTVRGREVGVVEAINHCADFYLQRGSDLAAKGAELVHRVRQTVRSRKTEQERVQSEEERSNLFPAIPCLESISDFTSGRLIDVNDAFVETIGYSRDGVLGKKAEFLGFFADLMIKSVFFNILDNAIRHAEKGSEIRVSSWKRGEDLGVVWEEKGIGIPSDENEQILKHEFGKNTGLCKFLVTETLSLTDISIREIGEPGKVPRSEIGIPKGMWRITGKDG